AQRPVKLRGQHSTTRRNLLRSVLREVEELREAASDDLKGVCTIDETTASLSLRGPFPLVLSLGSVVGDPKVGKGGVNLYVDISIGDKALVSVQVKKFV